MLAAAIVAAPAQAQIEAPFGLCHAVPVAGQTVNKYVLIQPNQSGVVNGHDGHPKDIVLAEGESCPSGDGGDGGDGGGDGGGGAQDGQTGTPAATEQPADELALTGSDTLVVGLIGLGLAGLGLGVRRLTSV
jgi:hypothetical protein